MPDLLIVTGPPGAGKSTVAQLLADRYEPSALIEGDAFFGFLHRGAIAPWERESHRQNEVVTEAAASAAGRYAAGGFSTVYDGVVGPWFLPTFMAAAGVSSADYAILLPSVDRCLERVRTRRNHGFSDEAATRKMHDEFANANIDRRHVLTNPPDNPELVADRIAAAAADGALAMTAW